MDISQHPTAILYALLAVLTAGVGVGVLVWQTGASQQALIRRRANLAGGVLLILIGGLVLAFQVFAIATGSYSTVR